MKKITKTNDELLLELDALRLENNVLKAKYEEKIKRQSQRENEQKYHLLVDRANEAIVVIQGGFLKLTNPMTRTMTGYSEEEIKAIPFQIFVHPEDRAMVINNHQKRLRGEDVPGYYVFRLITKEGKTLWVYMNAVLIDWAGAPAILCFLTDINELKLAEEALQQSSQKWEAVISASPDGIGMISLDGKIKLISDKLVIMHGYTVEEKEAYYGKSIFDFIDSSNHKLLIENIQKLLAGESDRLPTEYLAIKKDKSRFHIDVKASVINDSDGKPESILYVERDITERKLAEEEQQQSNQKLEAIISATPDGIGMISLDGKLLLMSDKLPEMYGYSIEQKDELIGRSVFDFIHPSNHQMLKDNVRKLLAGESDNKLTEYLALKKDNSRFYIDVHSTVLFDSNGMPTSILFVERDITERKHAESIIQQQYNQLNELNNTKDKFFSIIAHDLKSPFQSLLSSSELLATEIETLSNEEIIFFSKGINNSLKNLFGLLENLLQWSMMQRNILEYNPVSLNLNDTVNNIIEISNQSAVKKNVLISNNVDSRIFVNADVDMLRSIVQNLITNAIKFTPSEGRIIVSSIEQDDFVEVSVQDTGIGMEPYKSSELFNFNSLYTTNGTSGEKGTGLGLSLCKEFVERNGGKIWVESELGKGSKFRFTLRKLSE